jgi:hypothetical protein
VVTIVFTTSFKSTVLDINGFDAVVKGLRLLQLVGNEDEIKEAISLLKFLGEPIQERPVSLN